MIAMMASTCENFLKTKLTHVYYLPLSKITLGGKSDCHPPRIGLLHKRISPQTRIDSETFMIISMNKLLFVD